MALQVQPLGLGGILDHAIQLVRQRFGLLVSIPAILYVPLLIVIVMFVRAGMPDLADRPTEDEVTDAMLAMAPGAIALGILFLFVITPICNAAMIHAISAVYLKRPITIGQAFSRAVRVLGPLLWTTILYGIIFMIGLVLFIIPGIIFFFWYYLCSYIVVVEGTSGMAALKRSKTLMKGNIGTLFLLLLILGIIGRAIEAIGDLIPNDYLSIAVAILIQTAIMVFTTAASVVFYFSCRCKNEHFDLALLAQAVGEDSPPRPAGDWPRG